MAGSDAPSYEDLVEQMGFASKTEAYNVIVNVKRRFHRTWSTVLEEKLGTTDAVVIEDELGEIRRCLSMIKELNLQEVVSKLPGRQVTDQWELQSVSHEHLSRLFDYATNRSAQFTETELRALYRSYASGSLIATFEQCHRQPPNLLIHGESAPSIGSIDGLLGHPDPPLELLNDIRRFPRGILKSEYSTVPAQVPSRSAGEDSGCRVDVDRSEFLASGRVHSNLASDGAVDHRRSAVARVAVGYNCDIGAGQEMPHPARWMVKEGEQLRTQQIDLLDPILLARMVNQVQQLKRRGLAFRPHLPAR
jgi:hypothetical protein